MMKSGLGRIENYEPPMSPLRDSGFA